MTLASLNRGRSSNTIPTLTNERGVVIEVVARCEPHADGLAFLLRAQAVVVGAAFGFNHRVVFGIVGALCGVVCVSN